MAYKEGEETKGRCPKCGYIFDCASCIGETEEKPRIGDISICINCGAVNVFDEIGTRECTTEEFEELDAETKAEVSKIKRAREALCP